MNNFNQFQGEDREVKDAEKKTVDNSYLLQHVHASFRKRSCGPILYRWQRLRRCVACAAKICSASCGHSRLRGKKQTRISWFFDVLWVHSAKNTPEFWHWLSFACQDWKINICFLGFVTVIRLACVFSTTTSFLWMFDSDWCKDFFANRSTRTHAIMKRQVNGLFASQVLVEASCPSMDMFKWFQMFECPCVEKHITGHRN